MRKKYFFLKWDKQYISIYKPLDTKEQNRIIKLHKKTSHDQTELAWQTCNPGNQGQANLRYPVKVVG